MLLWIFRIINPGQSAASVLVPASARLLPIPEPAIHDTFAISKRCSRSSRPGRTLFRSRETWSKTRLCACKRNRGLAVHWHRARGVPDSRVSRLARDLDGGIPGESDHGGVRSNFD